MRYWFCILIMILIISGYAQELLDAVAPVKEVSFSIYGPDEHISRSLKIRDLHILGKNKYRYSGNVKIDTLIYQAEFTKKLRHVLFYQNHYYFICQEYFAWKCEFDFYVAPNNQEKTPMQKLAVADIPIPILQYQFPSENKNFLCYYEIGVLHSLLDHDICKMISMFEYYITESRVADIIAGNNLFQIVFLRILISNYIDKNKFSDSQKHKLFEIFKKILWLNKDMQYYSSSNIYWVAVALMKLSPHCGNKTITAFLKYCNENEGFHKGAEERQRMLLKLKGLISHAKN